jgi:ABC-type multidrug transport system fused ATPase/permease subunit
VEALFNQIGRYLSFSAWFFRDAFLRYRLRLILIAVANIVGVGFQALAVVIAYRYASAVEAGKTIELGGYVVDPRASFGLLAATAVAAFVVSVAAAVFVMRARVEGAKVALDYSEYCSQRIYSLLSRGTLHRTAMDDYSMERFFQLTRQDGRYWAQVLRIMSYGMLHFGTLIVAGAALLYLDPYLTLVVLAILTVAMAFLRRTSIRGASQRERVQRHAPEMRKDRRVLEDRVLRNPAPVSLADVAVRQAVSEGGAGRRRSAQLGQRQALENGKLIAQIAIGCALFLVLIVQGAATLNQASNWSALLAYVAALSFFGGSLAKVGRMMVNINRFYPPLARHARFVQRAERAAASTTAGPYVLDAPFLGGVAPGPLELAPGARVAVILPGELTRLSMMPVAKALRPLDKEESSAGIPFPWFAPGSLALSGASLRENLGLPPECSTADLAREVASLGKTSTGLRLPDSLDRPLTEADREGLSPPALLVLAVVSGLLNDRPIIAMEGSALAGLAPDTRETLLQRTSSAITLVAYVASATKDVSHHESAIIIAGSETMLGWTRPEIMRAGDEAVSRALERAAAESRASRAALLDEDDLEELE